MKVEDGCSSDFLVYILTQLIVLGGQYVPVGVTEEALQITKETKCYEQIILPNIKQIKIKWKE